MKTCIIQPAYSVDYTRSDEMFQWELQALDQCDESMDLIVLPEASDVPCLAHTREEFVVSYKKYGQRLLEKCAETARRCNAVVFVNAYHETPTGVRNTTHAFDRNGQVVGRYYKQHLTPGEVAKNKRNLDSEYSFTFDEPTVITIEGVRYAFLTCYDFYFYEAFPPIARQNVDVIIGCSHQRSDTHEAISILSRFLAYNCNAYVVRSSVSMDENSNIGGGSMIIAPDGTVLAEMGSRVGMATAEFDPKAKYYKPAGYGNPHSAHYEYIEQGRRPWFYRPGGSAIVRTDEWMAYPRVCAHRGFGQPENSLPALAAAAALGAEEIEFDVWSTVDGELVVCHDADLERLSNGTGLVADKTYAELKALDFGCKAGERYAGLTISTLEEVLNKLSCHAIINLHLKTPQGSTEPYDEAQLRKLLKLIFKYDCVKHLYVMSGNDAVLKQLKAMAPWLQLCCGGGIAPEQIVDRAIAIGCEKVQLVKGHFDQAMIDKAHEHGIRCNVFWSDDADETRRFLEMGIDTILTNEYVKIAPVVRAFAEGKA